jgi:KUP system potassium uptake protein
VEAEQTARGGPSGSLAALSVGALGVVFGDIGTSPLYTFKTVLAAHGSAPDERAIIGSLSLIFWTLTIITTVKYVSFAMRIDNEGEGGILALMSLLGIKKQHRPAVVALGLFGAALIYGDGAITPAISVLSALEGLQIATPALSNVVLPCAVAILIALFAIQPLGTARIGRAFGPIMILWFVTIAVLGIVGIMQHPSVLVAIDPTRGLRYLFAGGWSGFLVLGGVFLCVTGAEALYADMGHFGPRPIRLSWMLVVFPSLLINYAGQAAMVLEGAPTTDNIFYRLCPSFGLIPLVILATVATIIASQSIIAGAFSMTRQAIQLGWMPRLRITQTSEEGYGQIYVGTVNWLLMLATVGLTIVFRKSDNLAAAYGIAVSATMLMTSVLLGIAMREIWGWSLAAAGAVAGAFALVDASFFLANLQKVLEGGYVPIVLAAFVYGVMLIWHFGTEAIQRRFAATAVPLKKVLDALTAKEIPRVKGTAVFLTRATREAPPVMVWHLKHNRSLHEKVLVITVSVVRTPWVQSSDRLQVEEVAPHFYRAFARFGFVERPDLPALLRAAQARGCKLDLDDVTYYVGHETVVPREKSPRLPRVIESLYAAMQRNSVHVSDYFRIPPESVVEIGREIAI